MGQSVGEEGLRLIKQFEGCRLTAYKAVPTEKYWTIGWGHYGPDVSEGQSITQEEADGLLLEDCQQFANAVDNPKYCPLTDQLNGNQRDALISFTFNCGVGRLETLCRNRTLPEIRNAMALYNRSGGKKLPGLVRRRAAEQELFDLPVQAAEPEMDNTPSPAHREGVEWALEHGILRGGADGNLMLSQPVTRQQLCTMLYRTAQCLFGGAESASESENGGQPQFSPADVESQSDKST